MLNKNCVILLSGGTGKRFDKKNPKQFYKIFGETILEINVRKFLSYNLIDKIIIVTSERFFNQTEKVCKKFPNITITIGGENRQESVKNGLIKARDFNPKKVLIHDSARPFFNKNLITELLLNVDKTNACIPFLKINDAIRKISNEGKKIKDVDRTELHLIQTPQAFPFNQILKLHFETSENALNDDSILYNNYNLPIKFIDGLQNNIKITTQKDIEQSHMIYKFENRFEESVRVGTGFDVHAFTEGKEVILCGIKIPFNKKLLGHSDADVGLHAITDAILGALSCGDIGEHFPPSDSQWKDAPSQIFLKYSLEILKSNYGIIENVDLTFICEKPKIIEYKEQMKNKLSSLLNLEKIRINVKATTTERLGFLGREEGIAAQALVTIKILNKDNAS